MGKILFYRFVLSNGGVVLGLKICRVVWGSNAVTKKSAIVQWGPVGELQNGPARLGDLIILLAAYLTNCSFLFRANFTG